MMKKVSLYTQGGLNHAGFRYRFYQYFKQIDIFVNYRKGLSDKIYNKYMPLGEKNILIKILAFISMFFRTSNFLFRDLLHKPDFIIISRALIKPVIPFFYRWILISLKKRGTKIYWDFDDNILEFKEISRKSFDFFSEIADNIIIASTYLKDIIKKEFHPKIIVLPTTDGELIKLENKNRVRQLSTEYNSRIKLLWIGTSSSIKFLHGILSAIEVAGQELKKQGKELILVVVCNRSLDYTAKDFTYIFKKWTIEEANNAFLSSHIGLMPLDDSLSAKGKGGLKLIQYLSIGIPSIASPTGINKDILSNGGGYLVELFDKRKWTDSITKLSSDIDLWNKCSKEARYIYKCDYNYDNNLMIWRSLFD